MGQKANPNDVRIGITTRWLSTWYADAKTLADTFDKTFLFESFFWEIG